MPQFEDLNDTARMVREKRETAAGYSRTRVKVSAVIVTRGDVDLSPCLSTIEADEVVIVRGHGGVWERWEAAARARHDVIYLQDDDCVVDYPQIMAQYDPARVACNMPEWKRPEYPDRIALVGWGCAFHRALLDAPFARYRSMFPEDEWFRRECDRVFTGLSPLKLVDVAFTNLPYASAKTRMGSEVIHGTALRLIRERIYRVREQEKGAA